VVSGTVITLPGRGNLARTGYSFGGWNTNNNGTGTNYAADTSYTVTDNITFYSKWTIIYTLTASVSPSGGGTVSPSSGSYTAGTSVDVTATAASGYMFTGWSGASIPTNSNVTITMNNNMTLVANFTQRIPGAPLYYGNQTYRTVIIGNQTWMARNLDYETSSGSWLYDHEYYSRVYDWNTARTVCPGGWHLPTRAEWDVLLEYAKTSEKVNNHWPGAGTKLKSTSGWDFGGLYPEGRTDDYGFSALPGGSGCYCDSPNVKLWPNVGTYGSWWTDTEYNASYAYTREMGPGDTVFEYDEDGGVKKDRGISVRCVKND
jgi:uncharacterized protein (TIGR02145 family)/uncharacterized repeat protein (TIGR02543 family)